MFARLRGGKKAPQCGDFESALLYLQSENEQKLAAATAFISKSMIAQQAALPPSSVLVAVLENGLNAESSAVREQSLGILLVACRTSHRPLCWEQCRRCVKRELVEGDLESLGPFRIALLVLASLPAIEKVMFVCSRDGQACIRSVTKISEPGLRAAAVPLLAQMLLEVWHYLDDPSSEGVEGMQMQWIAEDGHDAEVEWTSDEPHRIKEDLYLYSQQFFREAALGCLGRAPSGDPMQPLPESPAATAGYFQACLQVVRAFLSSRSDGLDCWLNDMHARPPSSAPSFAPLAPYLSTIFDTLLGDWPVACDKAHALLHAPFAGPAWAAGPETHDPFAGTALLGSVLLALCTHVAPNTTASSRHSLPFSSWHVMVSSSSPSTSSPSSELQTMVRTFTRLHLLPLVDSLPSAARLLQTLRLAMGFLQADFMAHERGCSGAPNGLADTLLRGLVRSLQHTHSAAAAGGFEAVAPFATSLLLLLRHLRDSRAEIQPCLPILLESLIALAACAGQASSRLVSHATSELVVLICCQAGPAGPESAPPVELRASLGQACVASLLTSSRDAPRSPQQRGKEQVAWIFVSACCQTCIHLLHTATPPPSTLSNALLILNKFSNYLSSSGLSSSPSPFAADAETVQLVQSCWLRLASALAEMLLGSGWERHAESAAATGARAELCETLDQVLDWHFDDVGATPDAATASAHAARLSFLLLLARFLCPMSRPSGPSGPSGQHDASEFLRTRALAILDLLLRIVSSEPPPEPSPVSTGPRVGAKVLALAALPARAPDAVLPLLDICAHVVEQVIATCGSRAPVAAALTHAHWVEVGGRARACLERVLSRASPATAGGQVSAALLVVRLAVGGILQRLDAAAVGPPPAVSPPGCALAGIDGAHAFSHGLQPIEAVLRRHFSSPSPSALSSSSCSSSSAAAACSSSLRALADAEPVFAVVSGSCDLLTLLVAVSPIDGTHRVALHIKAVNASGFRLPCFSLSVLVAGFTSGQGHSTAPAVEGALRPVDFLPRGGVACWQAQLRVSALDAYSLVLRVVWRDLDAAPSMSALGLFADGPPALSGRLEGGDAAAGGVSTRSYHTLSAPYAVPVAALCLAEDVSAVEWRRHWASLQAGVHNVRVHVSAEVGSGSAVVLAQGVFGWLLRSAFGETVALCCVAGTGGGRGGSLEVRSGAWRAVEVVSRDIRAVLLAVTGGFLMVVEDDEDEREDEENLEDFFR